MLDNVVVENSHVNLGASGSRLTRAVFRGSLGGLQAAFPALKIAAADVVLSQCEVTLSRGTGVQVEVAGGVRINDCNLYENAGPAIDNRAAETVDGRNNWWGDPAGPNGPNGDGVAGNVLIEPYRTQAVLASTAPAVLVRR